MTTGSRYPRLCEQRQLPAEAAARQRARRAWRFMLAGIACAVFGAVLLCVVLAARGGDSSANATRIATDRVDAVEVNYVYSGDGCLTLTQVVWWVQEDHGTEVVDWRLFRPGMEPHFIRGWWVTTWIENGSLVRVEARSCYVSWTQFDVELVRREAFAVERRRKVGGR